ncbi:MAG: hypothetical protein AB1806_21685 [Acidobacteriota bacterium]
MLRCFAIMPYGGLDEAKRKHYQGVYQSIIAAAAAKAGCDVRRSDIAGEPGNITHDIIRDLAEADVVIADLTESNANVFFELGIRHVFRKSGTVHVVDKNSALPFDVRQYRTIPYSTDLAELPEVVDAIAAAIAKRQAQPTRSDNPVHDALPSLPINVRSIGEDAMRDQVEALQQQVDALQAERDLLQKKVTLLDPAGTVGTIDRDVDVDAILDEADEIMKSTGEHVLLKLTSAADSGGTDAFVRTLRQVLRSPFLHENDFVHVAKMCTRLGLQQHTLAVFEVARRRFPANEDFVLALADSYDDSPSPDLKERGRLLLESYLGVRHTDGGPMVGAAPKPKALHAAGILFNAYFHQGKLDWVLSVADSAEKVLGADSRLVRNKARALAELGRREEAEAEFKRALTIDPNDDTTHAFYSDFLDDLGRFMESYEEHEEAVFADPNDGSRFSNLGIHILNRGLVRTSDASIVGPLPRKERVRFALPLFLRSLEDEDRSGLLRPHVLSVLVRADAVAEAQAVSEGRRPDGAYDTAPLDYIEAEIRRRQDVSQR